VLERNDLFPAVERTTQRGARVPEAGMKEGVYRIRPFPARFIALFKCSASECIDSHLTRSIIPFLPGVETSAVEFEGRSQGYVQEVPWRNVKTHEVAYASETYTQNALFFRRFLTSSSGAESTSLLSQWMTHLYPRRARIISPGGIKREPVFSRFLRVQKKTWSSNSMAQTMISFCMLRISGPSKS
jgi:hypothetical protein